MHQQQEEEEVQQQVQASTRSQSSNLLSLPYDVAHMLIRLLKGADDGEKGRMKTILNLREVCSTTMTWIDDDTQVNEGRWLFSRSQIHVDISESTLKRFFDFPPPRHVSSLRLSGVSNVEGLEEAFKRFGEYWTTITTDINNDPEDQQRQYLDSLEIDTYAIGCSALMDFLKSPQMASLKKFRYEKIIGWPAPNIKGVYPSFFPQLQEFQIDKTVPSWEDVEEFCSELGSNMTARKFNFLQAEAYYPILRPNLLRLIEAKKNDADFQLDIFLRLHLYNCRWPISDEESRNLYKTIVESRSSIRLRQIDIDFWPPCRDEVSAAKRLELSQGVESFIIGGSGSIRFVDIRQFPNLKRLHVVEMVRPGRELYKTFRRLSSSSVTSLVLDHVECSERNLIVVLDTINRRFPNLTSLEIRWTRLEDRQSLQRRNIKFANLTTLNFTLNLGATDPSSCVGVVDATKHALFTALGIADLPLRKLKFWIFSRSVVHAQHCFQLVVQEDFLTAILKGQIMETLTELTFSHDHEDVIEGAKASWVKLKEAVELNYRGRVQSHGLCRGQLI